MGGSSSKKVEPALHPSPQTKASPSSPYIDNIKNEWAMTILKSDLSSLQEDLVVLRMGDSLRSMADEELTLAAAGASKLMKMPDNSTRDQELLEFCREIEEVKRRVEESFSIVSALGKKILSKSVEDRHLARVQLEREAKEAAAEAKHRAAEKRRLKAERLALEEATREAELTVAALSEELAAEEEAAANLEAAAVAAGASEAAAAAEAALNIERAAAADAVNRETRTNVEALIVEILDEVSARNVQEEATLDLDAVERKLESQLRLKTPNVDSNGDGFEAEDGAEMF